MTSGIFSLKSGIRRPFSLSMSNAAALNAALDFKSPAHAAANPVSGPRRFHVELDGVPYTGAHTRRALRAAMTRAGVETCTVNGVSGYNKASLAYFLELA